jgi:hypothetical protein
MGAPSVCGCALVNGEKFVNLQSELFSLHRLRLAMMRPGTFQPL